MDNRRDFTERFSVADVVACLGGLRGAAEKLGVSVSAVSQWRAADCFPPIRALQLADYFDLSPEFFHDPWTGVAKGEVPRADAADVAQNLQRSIGDD